jgi:hypothetical protein
MSKVIEALESSIKICLRIGLIADAQVNNVALTQARLDDALLHINIGAMAEIKATIDGKSTQPVKDIVYGAIAEIEAWKAKE